MAKKAVRRLRGDNVIDIKITEDEWAVVCKLNGWDVNGMLKEERYYERTIPEITTSLIS